MQTATLLKGDSNTGVFLTIFRKKFLRTAILKTTCERLFLRVFPLSGFPTLTNNITSYIGSEGAFSKTKQKIAF